MADALRFGGKRLRFGGKNLLWSGSTPHALVVRIRTDNEGVSDDRSFTIPVRSGYAYNYTVSWGDGTADIGVTGSITHTYDTSGEKTIRIYGQFSQFYFNNGGDRLKVLSIDGWGDVQYSVNNNMMGSFYGCSNLESISDGASWFDTLVTGTAMFYGNNLTSLPEDMMLGNLTGGVNMLRDNQLTVLPDGMVLGNLTNGQNMFNGNNLTSLPYGMALENLTTGNSMFINNQLTFLPDGMVLGNLTNGTNMFSGNNLTSLPEYMVLGNLTTGAGMFNGNTINTERYSKLLIDIEASNQNINVPFHGGSSRYNSSAIEARASLVDRGWIITDGGLE